jgi:surface protein
MNHNKKEIIAKNDNLKSIITEEIFKFGNTADLNHIKTHNVTSFNKLFLYSSFDGDISQWDTSNVLDMENAFSCSRFNGNISNWNVSNVVIMVTMFSGSSFNGDISKWDVSNVRHMSDIFRNSTFNQDIGDWKFHPKLTIYKDLQIVLENSHNIRLEKEANLLKRQLLFSKKQQNNSL